MGEDIEKEIYDMFMTEITVGIGTTGVKAGVIKLATSKNIITEYENIFFRAAGKVSKETGTPIITHTQEGTMGPDQAKLMISEGASPEKIMIGHMDGNINSEYHIKTMSHGVSVGFDRCGIQEVAGMPMDESRIELICELFFKNYNRIMLSSDCVWTWLGRPLNLHEDFLKLLKNWSPVSIFENIIPALEQKGITKEQIEKMLVDNPKNLFS